MAGGGRGRRVLVFLQVERRRDGDQIAGVGRGRRAVVTVELCVGTVGAGLGDLDTVRVVETVAGRAGQGGEP